MAVITMAEYLKRLAYAQLASSLYSSSERQRQCERCSAQWTLHPRYGWALSSRTLFGCATFVCPDCQRRRA